MPVVSDLRYDINQQETEMRTSDVHIRRQALNAPRWLTTLNGPMLSAVVGGSLVAFVFISAFAR